MKSAINISLNIASVNNSNAYKNGSNSTDAISVCEQNYQLYLIALSNFNASAYAQNHNFNFLPPVANFNDFYNRGFCSCVVLYIAYLNHYINDPVPPIDDAEELHNWSGCTSIKEEPCEIFFQQYKQGVIQYNQWAVSVGYPLLSTSLFVDHKEFYDKGYCFCYEAYNSYLGNYTNGNFPIGSPPADDITFFNGCKEEGVECREEYQQYVHAIDVFNASHPNQTPLIPLHEQLFYILGYCDCVREYIDYLKNLEVGEIAVNIYEWQGCNSTNTECREDWAIYQSTVNHYNATYNANLTIIPEQQFYASGYCDCVRDYVDYLNNIGNGSAVSINQWEGCNCKEEYTQYAVAVANYNHTYGANVAVMPEAQFYASGYCQCVKDYMTYLNTIGNGNAVSIDVWEGCNPDLCVDLYNAYVAAVNDFNNNHPSNPISQPLSSTVFVNSGYCSCVEDYISYLSSIISNPLAFGLDINVWEGCNSDSCSIAYSNYVNALNTYNNTHNPDLTPITHSVFVNSGYCVCGNNYANYISQLPPSIQGVNINAWAGCNDTCQTIYSNYTTAVNNFNSTHTNPIAAPIAFNTFVNAGYCVCSSNYVTYLASIPTNGYAVNISNWGGCNNDSCSQAYTDYVAALNTYNSNHSPDLVPLAYTPFVNGGYCNCTEDYIAYITQLPPPVVGVNINAWSGCNDPCTVTYNAYVAQVQAYNTSSYATSHGHTLIVLNATTFYNNDYCNCVLPSDSDPNTIDNAGYNAYLNLYITNAVDPLAAPPVSILNWDGCNDEDDCVEWFTTYQQAVAAYQAWQPQQSNPTFPVLNPPAYSYDDFVSANLCNCATGYAAYLNSIVDGLVPLSELNTNHLLVAGYCEDTQPLVTCNNSFPVNPYNPPVIIPENPCDYQIQMNADLNANLLYTQHLQLLTSEFAERYNQHCLGSVTENFTMSYPDREYHFTLYYYDQEGNLVRTVPPEGVQLLDITAPNSPVEIEVIADRTNGTKNVFTDHKLYSTYEYNSLNQLVRQSLPDHDKMNICEFCYQMA
ncbi:MAG: hypothetical protein IPJ79_20775 [Bacteroidetes bacterium]|nr:hypothetical protein [Bacteroidota bacterium]